MSLLHNDHPMTQRYQDTSESLSNGRPKRYRDTHFMVTVSSVTPSPLAPKSFTLRKTLYVSGFGLNAEVPFHTQISLEGYTEHDESYLMFDGFKPKWVVRICLSGSERLQCRGSRSNDGYKAYDCSKQAWEQHNRMCKSTEIHEEEHLLNPHSYIVRGPGHVEIY